MLWDCNVPLNMIQLEHIGEDEYNDCLYISKSNEFVDMVEISIIYENVPDVSFRIW